MDNGTNQVGPGLSGNGVPPSSPNTSASTTPLPSLSSMQPSLTRSEGPATPPPSSGRPRWMRRNIIIALVLAILAIIAAIVVAINQQSTANKTQPLSNATGRFAPLTISLDELSKSGSLFVDGVPSLNINGQLKVNNSLVLNPTERPRSGVEGQLYYDQTSNRLRYYDGTAFRDLMSNQTTVQSIAGTTGNLTLGSGLSLSNGQLNTVPAQTQPSVSSIQGQTGAVNFTAGGGIAIDGTTVSNTGVTALGGTTGDVSVGTGLTVANGTLANDGVVSLAAGTSNLVIADDGNGNLTISNVGAGTGTVSSPGGTAGRIAKFTGAQTLEDSLLGETGSTVTVNGNLTVTGSLALSSLLSVANGGTGAASLANNGVLIGQGTSPITAVTAAGSGLCLMSTAGAPSFQACPGGGGGVTSLNAVSGDLTLANSSASGSTITIDNASTTQKGIASFNNTNFSVSSGAVNTIQNINTSATPTFAGINTNSITPSGALTVGATTQSLTLQGSNTTVTRTNGANTASLTFVAPTANVTYRLQTAAAGTYDVCTTAGNCTGVGGGVTTPGGSANQLARFTGTQTLGDSIISDDGALVTVAGNLTVTGTTTLSTPLAITSGGTGAADATTARGNLGAAKSGANSDITSLTGLTTALSVVQGGTGATSLTANGVLLGNGTSAISSLAAGGAGQCLVSTAGAPIWSACPGSGGVSSINSQTGAVTIANASATGGTVTIDNASTSQKGIAQFNSTNFSVTSGIVNTTQDINVTAAPTFGRLSLSSSQASNPMLLVNNTNASGTGNLIDLQLNGSSRLAVTPAGNMTLTGTLNGQTISSAANLTGTLAVAGQANLNGGAAVTGTLSANTITPSSALTVGATNQSFTLQGNVSSTLTATSGVSTTTVAFQTPTANVSYRLLTAAAGTYDICTTAGNCTGVGGGVTTSGGTTNRLAKFSGSQTLTDSIITDNGTTVSIGGTLAVNTITPSGAMTVGSTGQNLALQGAATTLSSTSGGTTNTLSFATPSGGNKSIVLPNASGTLAVSASGPLAIDASGNISCATCVTNGGGSGGQSAVDSINGLTGDVTIANSSGSGGTVTIDDASTTQKGIAQFNSTNFSVSGGVVNTIQDINTTAAPTFGRLTLTSSQASSDMLVVNNTNVSAAGSLLALQLNGANRFTVDAAGNVVANGTLTSGAINGQTISSAANFTGTMAVAGLASLNGGATVTGTLTANTITPSSAMAIGAAGQSLTLQGNASTVLRASDSGNTTSVAFQTPTANVIYRFLTTAAGTYDVCTTVGNCAGIGGGVTTAGGTAGTIAKFTSSGVIADSLLSESGGTVAVGGNLNLSAGSQYRINGTQISSANLSNDANLAKLNGAQTFTGSSNLFKPGSNSTTAFQVQPSASTTPVFNVDTTNSRVGIGTAAPSYALDVAGDVNIGSSNAYKINGVDICTASGCTIAAGSGSYIQNQNTTDQTANFRIDGTGRVGTAVQTPLLDTASATTLNLGTTNATGIALNKDTTVTGSLTQSGTAFSLTGSGASSLTTGSGAALAITSGATTTWGTTNGGSLTVQSVDTNTSIQLNSSSRTMNFNVGASSASTGTINLGSSNTRDINIGTTSNNVRNINIGISTGSNAQTIVMGGTGGSSSTTIQGGTGSSAINLTPGSGGDINLTSTGTGGDINLLTGSKVFVRSTTNSTTAFQIKNNLQLNTVFNADTQNSRVGINMDDPNYTLDVFGDANVTALSSYRIGGTQICTSSGCTAASGSSNYIQNQNSTSQSANLRITGTARADTSLQAPLLDTASAAVLALGTTNATAINLNQNTTIASGKTLTANGTVLFKNNANSVTSFQVQPAASTTPVLNVDTSNSRVGIGTAAPRSDLDLGTGGAKLTVGNNTSGGSISFGDISNDNAITYAGSGLNFYTLQSNGFRFYTDTDTDPSTTPEFQIADNGSANFRNNANSTSALTVQNAAGTNILTVNTTTPTVTTIGNAEVKDAATSTKSVRTRTTGSTLDFEASGSNLVLSTWSGADYTGTQYNQITFYSDGSNMVAWRGMDMNGTLTVDASSTTFTQRLCHNQANGATTDLQLGDCQATGQADLAEFYDTDGMVEPGDIVMPSATGAYKVERAQEDRRASAIGVASTNPIADGIIGYSVKSKTRQPIALAGRVPLKVSLENGAIAVGDPLTLSSQPGIAMKATGAGPIIGTALEAFDESSARVSALVAKEEVDRDKAHKGVLSSYRSDPSQWPEDVGKIMLFVKAGYYSPAQDVQGQKPFQDLAVQGQLSANSLNVASKITTKDLVVTGVATIARLEVTDVVVAGDLSLKGHLIGSGGIPQVSAADGVCAGTKVALTGTDTAGLITVTTPAGCVLDGPLARVQFHKAFGAKPNVSLTPASAEAATLRSFVNSELVTPEGFVVSLPVSTPATGVYRWYYQVIQ